MQNNYNIPIGNYGTYICFFLLENIFLVNASLLQNKVIHFIQDIMRIIQIKERMTIYTENKNL